MAYDFDGTDDYVQLGASVTYAPPLTISCWFNADVVPTSARNLLQLAAETVGGAVGTTGNHMVGLVLSSNATLLARAAVNNGNSSSQTTNTFTAGTWSHALGRFASGSSRIAALDGVVGTDSGTLRSATALDNVLVGRGSGGTYSGNLPFNGKVAEIAAWSVTLTDSEIQSLADGAKATSVRPTALITYVPAVRELIDVHSSSQLTASGAVVSIHPRRYG